MLKHAVMWKFKEGEEENMNKFLQGLKSLYGQIEEIKMMEVHTSIKKDGLYDAILICGFDSEEDLEKYKNDERHQKVSKLCKQIREARASVDWYE